MRARGKVWHVGAHIARKKTLLETLQEVERAGGNALQIFASNPRSGRFSEKAWRKFVGDEMDMRAYVRKMRAELWIHTSYVVNLAAPFPGGDPARAWWLDALRNELEVGARIGVRGVIVHVGRAVSAGSAEKGRVHMKEAVAYLLQHMPADSAIRLVLETAAGQGSEILVQAAELGAFVRPFPKNRLGVCFDSAHVWAAGYDVSAKTLEVFAKACGGVGRVALLQLNNSPKEKGDRVDRHSQLLATHPQGRVPREGLAAWVKWAKKHGITVILETPERGYEEEIPWMLRMAEGPGAS